MWTPVQPLFGKLEALGEEDEWKTSGNRWQEDTRVLGKVQLQNATCAGRYRTATGALSGIWTQV